MNRLLVSVLAVLCAALITLNESSANDREDVIIENDEMKLVIAWDGIVKSLFYKPTREECLIQGKRIPVSTITQERPYQNEVKLAYPTKETTFKANSVRMEGNTLIVGYELIPWESHIAITRTPDYIGFRMENLKLTVESYDILMVEPPISEVWFLQLPVRNRGRYGDWLNVIWDDALAVNVLATDQYARIDSEEGEGYRTLQAGVQQQVKLKDVGAALITCPSDRLLDRIARVEEDFNLPHGVESRRSERYGASYYWSPDVFPGNVDEHINYAKMGGFRAFLIYYTAFMEGSGYKKLGNYEWRPAEYPNGKQDLAAMLDKINTAGMVPGFHFLHSHIGRESKYITPVPDHRLNLLKTFTLAKPLNTTGTTVFVDQNPAGSPMADRRRVLRIGTELLSYENYTTTRPYSFNGCVRAIDKTTVNSQPAGYMFGVLDVSEFGATSVYINQNNDLQEEIAEKLADIYSAGFRFCYFDGSEGVNPPFWYTVSAAQWKVHHLLKPEPLFAEGAAKTHFSWHMLSRGNAFDVFRPEALKESIKKFPAEEAPRMSNNFTHVNFGWLGYWVPSESTVGTQPDMLEYATSRAAAWDCPISLMANLKLFAAHARTADNLEVIKRWEDARAQHWLTEDKKEMLRNLEQEHTLLLNEKNELELAPYDQITDVAKGSREVRAFTFRRNNEVYAVYWHISGDRELELPVNKKDITLMERLGKKINVRSGQNSKTTIVPVGKRRYIKTSTLSEDELATAFKNAAIR